MGSKFYACPLTPETKEKITGISFPKNLSDAKISYEDLSEVHVLYVNFDGLVDEGILIVNNLISEDALDIFEKLFEAKYPIEKIRLIDDYGADDELSMSDNNSSAFCYRVIANTDILSNHALGMAIDINPLYNPYITYIDGRENIAPANSAIYCDREKDFPHKITEDDLCCRLFKEHGFTWGGDWEGKKDYQHFEKKFEGKEDRKN